MIFVNTIETLFHISNSTILFSDFFYEYFSSFFFQFNRKRCPKKFNKVMDNLINFRKIKKQN